MVKRQPIARDVRAAVVAVHRRVANVRDYRRVPLWDHLALARGAGGELVKDNVAFGDDGWPACSTSVVSGGSWKAATDGPEHVKL